MNANDTETQCTLEARATCLSSTYMWGKISRRGASQTNGNASGCAPGLWLRLRIGTCVAPMSEDVRCRCLVHCSTTLYDRVFPSLIPVASTRRRNDTLQACRQSKLHNNYPACYQTHTTDGSETHLMSIPSSAVPQISPRTSVQFFGIHPLAPRFRALAKTAKLIQAQTSSVHMITRQTF